MNGIAIRPGHFLPMLTLLTATLTMYWSAGVTTKKTACQKPKAPGLKDYTITHTGSRYIPELNSVLLEQSVEGAAGATIPKAKGSLNGAPVQGYVFPTNLKSEDVGFDPTEGIVALALTSHHLLT